MTENTIAFEPEPEAEGQPSGSEVQQDAQPGAEQVRQDYVTADQIKSLEERISRQIQSMTDKAAKTVSKQVREQVDALKDVARELEGLPSNVPQSVRDQVYSDAVASVKGIEVGDKSAQADPDFNKRIEMLGADILDAAGMTLEPNDPEYKTLVLNKSPEDYLNSITKAVKAKKQRLSTGETSEQVGAPVSRLPTMAVGSSTNRGEQAINAELSSLLSKSRMTDADRKRANELEVELEKYVK